MQIRKKHANIINQQKFVVSCRNENLIPKSLRYKLHLNTRKEGQFAHTLQLKTLVHIIKDKKQKRHIISSERKSLENYLFENLSTVDFSQVVRLERNLFSHDFRLSKERLYTKLEKLREESSMRNRIYSPRFTPGPGMVNLSSRTFETQEIETLEKGPKFSFLPKQVPVVDIVSSLESALHKYYPSVSNPDEVRSCLINTLYNSQKEAKSPTTFTQKKFARHKNII